jgi:hypothetical protein
VATIVQTRTTPIPSLAIWHGWLPLLILPVSAIALVPAAWPQWVHMWLLVVAVYAGFKWVSWRRTPASGAAWWRQAAYLVLWPGLDAAAFLGRRSGSKPTPTEWLFAAAKLALGAVLLWGVGPRIPPEHELLLGWIGMAGIVFVLHFGSIHLLSCFWRSLGIDARPLMEWPIAATSVSDFWGRRWNTAFRDLAHQFVFRPLVRRWGGTWALAASFVFSGLVHDLVISVPAEGGYGWSTLYFLVQGAAVFFERSRIGKALGLGGGWRGWMFAMLVLLVPAYGLFHPPFIHAVVVPFLQAIGAAKPT